MTAFQTFYEIIKKWKPEINISGNWASPEWGVARFKQEGREITGTLGDYPAKGVVAGMGIYLLMYSGDKVDYFAELKAIDNNTFIGSYSKYYLIDELKGKDRDAFIRPMNLKRVSTTTGEGKEAQDIQKTTPQPPPPAKPTYAKTAKKPSEYVCWGLGLIVKTDQKTTITEIIKEGNSSAKENLKSGDEIVKVGKDYIDTENAYKILTKPIAREVDDFVPVIVRRDGKDIQYRIKPNVF